MTDLSARRLIALAPLPLLGLLSACGGGGDLVASTPPPPAYTTLANATASTPLVTQAASLEFDRPDLSPTANTTAKVSNVQVSYDPATKTYQLRGTMQGTGQTIEKSFGPSDIVSNLPVTYDRSVTTVSRTDVNRFIPYQSTQLTYVAYGEWVVGTTTGTSQTIDSIYFTYGIPTQTGDMPKTGSASYTLGIGGSFNGSTMGGEGSLSANFASGTVDVSLSPAIPQRPGSPLYVVATLTGTGTIGSADGHPGFSAALAGNGYSGAINGLFYGPQASEVGGAFTANNGASSIAGVAVGKKN